MKNLKWKIKDSSRCYWDIEANRSDTTEDLNAQGGKIYVKEDGEVAESHHWWDYTIINEDGWSIKGSIVGQYDSPISLDSILSDVSSIMIGLCLSSKDARKVE